MKFSPVIPFEPIRTDVFPDGSRWVGQVKWDGVRMLVYYDGSRTELFNRKRHNRTAQYPELTDIRRYCSARSVILDGEVIALKDGKPSFHEVMKRDSARKSERIRQVEGRVPVTYMIFDILHVNGKWITDRPLEQRQQMLDDVLTPRPFAQKVDNHDDPAALFEVVSRHGLEGVVVKDLDSRYAMGEKDRRWQKKKRYLDLNAVVGGVTHRAGIVNALLLGLYDQNGQLWYIGHAGAGKWTQQDRREFTSAARHLRIPAVPFVNLPDRSQGVTWMKPELSVKIRFLEWTPNRTLRQPSIQAVVNLDPRDCTFDQP